MANRGGKAKDYRIPIVETLQWYKETAFDGLISTILFHWSIGIHFLFVFDSRGGVFKLVWALRGHDTHY